MEKKGLIIIAVLAILYWVTRTPIYTDNLTQIELKYHIEYTAGASSGATLPMIIALHGNGDSYDNFYKYTLQDFTSQTRVVLVEAPDKYWPYEQQKLSQYSTAIASLSQELQQQYPTSNKPLLLGYSGGGVVAYFSALTNCDSYSTVVPVSGMLKKEMMPIKTTMNNDCKVIAFHGKKDRVVGYSGGQYAIKQLQKHSDKARLISFDEEGHHLIFKERKNDFFAKVAELL